MILKKIPVQIEVVLSEMSDEYIQEMFAIDDVCNGEDVFTIFMQYMKRYMLLPAGNVEYQKTYFTAIWGQWLAYRIHDIQAAYTAYVTEFDPSSDYFIRETELKLQNDGEKTTTTKNKYDYSVEEAAGTGANAPTYSNYTTTFDSTAERLESKRIDAGTRTTRTTATNEELNKKTITTTHQPTTLSQGDVTYSADYIHALNMSKAGNIHRSPSENIEQALQLYAKSVLQMYVEDFLQRYTFYIGNDLEGDFV